MGDLNPQHKSHAFEPVCALAGSLAGWWIWRSQAFVALAAVFALLLVLSLVRPAAYAPFHRAQTFVAGWILRLVSWVVLFVVFALVFVPAGLVLRLCGRRRIAGRREAGRDGYWTQAANDADGFFTRQF